MVKKIRKYGRELKLFHNVVYFYVIYRYVISEWRSIRRVEINQYDSTMATHYENTMGNEVARDAHCEIIMGNDVARDIHIHCM